MYVFSISSMLPLTDVKT